MMIKVKLAGYDHWKHVIVTERPMSCGCGPTLEDLIVHALWEQEGIGSEQPDEQPEILAFRVLREQKQVGVTTLRVQRKYRSYGGPEEGGWYYDDPELVREFRVPSSRYAACRARLEAFCERANEGLRSWQEGALEVRTGAYERTPKQHYC